MIPTLNQTQILEEARRLESVQDDPALFTQIYDQYLNPVYRYLLSRVGNTQDAEDLTSQVFLTALERISQYENRGKSIGAWLITIARNKSNDHFRSRRPISLSEVDAETLAQGEDALIQLCRKDEARAIFGLIRRLPELDQDLLHLRFGAELSFAEIARLVGRKEDAVKKQTYRLLERIQQQMEVVDENS
jgi:RNA polymerase sigma-70 factor, ECF subfamily